MSLYKRYLLLLSFIGFSSAAIGQAASSPFSTYGMGMPYGNALIQNQGMGGVGVSQPQFWSVNNQNPALLVFNYNTTFQAGMLVEGRTIKSDTASQKGVYGNLNYLVIAFPVKAGKWTTSFGLMPFTNVNYKLAYTDDVISNTPPGLPVDTVAVIEQGSGGLNQFYWSNGVRIHDNFSIGLKATYVFGSVERDYSNLLDENYSDPDAPVPFIVGIADQTYVKDFMFSGGLSYSQDSIGKKHDYRLSAGLVYSFATDLRANKTTVVERRVTSGSPVTSDTLITNRGNVSVPSGLTVGLSLSRGSKWTAGVEFTAQDWSEFKTMNNDDERLANAWRIAAGGEYTPDAISNNYLKRISYRVGFSYEKSPILVNNHPLNDIGINFGFSCPTGSSSLDWGFRLGKRGDKAETILEESYYKIYFGISFNDRWFIKRKFD